jgi:hypothetical protein
MDAVLSVDRCGDVPQEPPPPAGGCRRQIAFPVSVVVMATQVRTDRTVRMLRIVVGACLALAIVTPSPRSRTTQPDRR